MSKTLVVTYSLIYQAGNTVDLCAACCIDKGHNQGSLGEAQHGAHYGVCEGAKHPTNEAEEGPP